MLIGTIITAIDATAALGSWLGWGASGEPAGGSSQAGAGVASGPVSAATTGAAPPPTTPFEFLSTLSPTAGAVNLAQLPRAVREDPAYARAIAISCPSNQSNDKSREVTYPLRGRFVELSATVRPYFEHDAQVRSFVYAVAVHKELDGTLTKREVGQQLSATITAPAPLRGVVERAEELTIQVRCDDPQGVVIIGDARLTTR